MTKSEEPKNIEFGDFQTPLDLAEKIAIITTNYLDKINTIVEPTCGLGSFIQAFIKIKTTAKDVIGWEINSQYVEIARKNLYSSNKSFSILIKQQDFFQVNWFKVNSNFKPPVLFIGNPPWVTNSKLQKLLSKNIPQKSNFQNLSGLEAITGKSNFDISEWIVIKICQQIYGSNSAMAFLVKTSVARKIYQYIAQNNLLISSICIREIDAEKYFKVNVDACLFFARGINYVPHEYICPVYSNLDIAITYKNIEISRGKIVSDIITYKKLSDIDCGCEFKWRSGVKHDASKIMELKITNEGLINGLGKIIDIPNDYLYPMYKSSDIAQVTLKPPKKMMIITQQKIGDNTSNISKISPQTWNYLIANASKLDARKSSIYIKSPRFAIFGVGDYTFKPWKITISGLYKNLNFTKIGLFNNKPIVLDDTCYMLGFDSEAEVDLVLNILQSDIATNFINSLVFKDNQRVITASFLNRINLRTIALKLELNEEFDRLFIRKIPKQLSIF